MHGNSAPASEMLDHGGAAAYLGISERLLTDLVGKREVPFYKYGHRTNRFDRSELDEWKQSRRIAPVDELLHRTRMNRGLPAVVEDSAVVERVATIARNGLGGDAA